MSTKLSVSSQYPSVESEHDTSQIRRAAKACSTCHARKTRCDVLQVGCPCTKCKDNNFRCSIEPRKKRRSKLDAGNARDIGSSIPTPRTAFPEHVISYQVPHYTFFRNLTPVGRRSNHSQDTGRGLILPIAPRDQPGDLRADDLSFLKQKGAFDLPPKAVLDECVSAYFRIFHPFLPIIDRSTFLVKYHQSNTCAERERREPSILLLQAIVFTASAFIPMQHIQEMGHPTRRQARSCFYTRAQYLHQFNYESDDIVTIQSLLLMSHYYPSMAEQRHTWFWVHQAIGLAQGAGLHRDSQQAPQRKLLARIWWACLVRDRLIALGTNRPMHINSLDCNVPLLTMADLEEEDDTDDARAIKAIFVDFVKLCHYMEGVLSLGFAASESLESQISVCESTLRTWTMNLSVASRRDGDRVVDSSHGSIPLLYRMFLHLVHNVVLIALLQSSNTLYQNRPARLPSTEVQSIAADSAGLLDEVTRLGLVGYFPTSSVTTILPPLIVQVLLMRSSDNLDDYEKAKKRFDICMTALGQLGHIYWHASFYHDVFKMATSSSTKQSASTQRSSTAPGPQRSIKATRITKRTRDRDPTSTAHESSPTKTLQGYDVSYEAMLPYESAFHNEVFMLDPEDGTPSLSLPTETDEAFNSRQWDFETMLTDSGGQSRLLHDWLDDNVLFRSLFPSA